MKTQANNIRPGWIIEHNGKQWTVMKTQVTKPGKGGAFMQVEMRDIASGNKTNERFRSEDTIEKLTSENVDCQFLYKDGDMLYFMNQETYDQIPIMHDLITGVDFMKEGEVVEVVTDASTETVLFAEVPTKVKLKITYTEPGVKGDTATNTLKPATVETGAGSYVGRVK